MIEDVKETSPFSQIGQVGIVVNDIDQAINYLNSLGIETFEPKRIQITERWLRGKPANYKCKLKFARLGSLELEMIQPIEGETIHKEFLESKGEGIHHLGFFVSDLDKEVAKLARLGVEVIQSGERPDGGGFAYLDTEKSCGAVIELIQR